MFHNPWRFLVLLDSTLFSFLYLSDHGSFGLLWCAVHPPAHHHLFRKSLRFRISLFEQQGSFQNWRYFKTMNFIYNMPTNFIPPKKRNHARSKSHGKSIYIDMHNGTNMTRYDDQKIHQPFKIWRTNPPTGWWFHPISKKCWSNWIISPGLKMKNIWVATTRQPKTPDSPLNVTYQNSIDDLQGLAKQHNRWHGSMANDLPAKCDGFFTKNRCVGIESFQ